MSLSIPKIWDIIDSFKEQCRLCSWETSETEDWVKTEDGKYHNFLWMRTIHPSTFEKITSNCKCGVCRYVSYEVVDIAYMAWLFQERPPEFILSKVKENPELSEKMALFDLSCAYLGEKTCKKFNKTDSRVFMEFEKFLEDELNLELKSVDEMLTLTM